MNGQAVSIMEPFPTGRTTNSRRVSLAGGRYEMADLLRATVEHQSSDLHIAVGRPPVLRIHGELLNVEGPVLTGQETRRLIYGVLSDSQKQKFEEEKELDFSL